MIIVIDGTGPASAGDYAREMRNSFCSQIGRAAGAVYFRGPTVTGSETSAIANLAVDAALAGGGAQGAGALMLAGYSRGGCAAIIAARRLKDRGVRVNSMFLFDAVDMQTSEIHLTQTISDNVDMVAHARSARSFSFWARNPIQSRFYFYNTGRWLAGAGSYETRSFVGSHGALGGVPWADIPQDAGCALAVASWMNERFAKRGLAVTIKPI
ncbi:MAG: thioesterase domain-containing protein [Caulobacteraceae bacterium]